MYLSWVRHVRRVRTITLIGGPKELRSVVQLMQKDVARYCVLRKLNYLDVHTSLSISSIWFSQSSLALSILNVTHNFSF